MKVTGSCHCGHITYEAEIDPARVGICNCTDCQVLTGSAFRVSVPRQRPPSASSPASQGLCQDRRERREAETFVLPELWTPVTASADSDDPPSYSLRVGCLAQKALLPPKRRIWCKSALPWSQDVSMIPGIDGQ